MRAMLCAVQNGFGPACGGYFTYPGAFSPLATLECTFTNELHNSLLVRRRPSEPPLHELHQSALGKRLLRRSSAHGNPNRRECRLATHPRVVPTTMSSHAAQWLHQQALSHDQGDLPEGCTASVRSRRAEACRREHFELCLVRLNPFCRSDVQKPCASSSAQAYSLACLLCWPSTLSSCSHAGRSSHQAGHAPNARHASGACFNVRMMSSRKCLETKCAQSSDLHARLLFLPWTNSTWDTLASTNQDNITSIRCHMPDDKTEPSKFCAVNLQRKRSETKTCNCAVEAPKSCVQMFLFQEYACPEPAQTAGTQWNVHQGWQRRTH